MKLNIGIVGEFQTGKSLLVNCILGHPFATVGKRTATTHTIVKYMYSETEYISFVESGILKKDTVENLTYFDCNAAIEEIQVYLNNPLLRDITLIDMPGFGADTDDDEKALRTFRGLDYAILLGSNIKTIEPNHNSYKDIQALKKFSVPYYFILNCIRDKERWDPCFDGNEAIAERDRDMMDIYPPLSFPFNKRAVPIVNLMWYWYAIRGKNDVLIKKNIHKFAEAGLLDEDVTKEEIKEASNFHHIQSILSMENQMYLTLKKEFKDELIRVKDEVCPIGTIQAFAFNDVPLGWLVCDGSALPISEYEALYDVIGDTFGKGGDDMFCLPDLRGQFVRGWDNSGKIDPGRIFGRSQNDTFQGHAHEVCLSSVEMKSSGGHDHDLYWATFRVRDASMSDFNNHTQLMAVPYADKSTGMYNRDGNDYEQKDGSSIEGKHTHELSIKKGMQPIGKPIESSFGPIKNHIGGETRPKNVALLFCIKAQSIADFRHSTKEELTMIKGEITRSVLRAVTPLSENLPTTVIGSEEYDKQIERIKRRHFSAEPTRHQDLLLKTWRCFNEICIYNARMGHLANTFDEHGLYLLVSWMAEQGFVGCKKHSEKLGFIDELKGFAQSLHSNLYP